MSHPYSGAASYIYANGRSTLSNEAGVTSNGYPYESTQWIAISSPTSVSQKMRPLSPISDQRSSDSVSPFATDIRSHKFEIFSTAPSYGMSALYSQSPKPAELPPPFEYKSIMVSFDTPSENVVVWRRQMKALKGLLKRFRRGLSRIFTPSWVHTPHPRLSMIR